MVVADFIFDLLFDRTCFWILGPRRHTVLFSLMVMPSIEFPLWTDLGLFRLSLLYAGLPLILSIGGIDVLRAIEIFATVVLPDIVG